MRVFSRIALVVILVVSLVPSLYADHLTADCPLTLVGHDFPQLRTKLLNGRRLVHPFLDVDCNETQLD